MSGILLPALLIGGAILAALLTYRGIRRGGARFYTLEREAVLRRAAVTLLMTVALFMGAIGLLLYQRQQLVESPVTGETTSGNESGELNAPFAATNTPALEVFPPTPSPTSLTPQPTETATPSICRAVVEGTSGNGLRMRDAPQGAEVSVLPEGTLLTVLEDAPVSAGDIIWRKVRSVGGEEGWVAEDFLTIRAPCN